MSAPTPSTTFRFFDLPLEIRMQIYGYLLELPDLRAARRWVNTGMSSAGILGRLPLTLGVLETCRAMRQEARDILYERNVFAAHPKGLTAFPYMVDPERPLPTLLLTPCIARLIRHWYLYMRVDQEPSWSIIEARFAFRDARSLQIDAAARSWVPDGIGTLRQLEHVRGLQKASVVGDVDTRYARWLERSLTTEEGNGLESYATYVEGLAKTRKVDEVRDPMQ